MGGSWLQQHRERLEQHGFSIRLAADSVRKMYFPDIYAWLSYQCNLWAWLGIPFPEPDDHRIAMMVDRFATATGEIEITGHVSWIAGVKC